MKAHSRNFNIPHTERTHRPRRGRRTRQFGAAIALTGLLLGTAACGDDDESQASGNTNTPAATAAEAESGAAGAADAPEGANGANGEQPDTQNVAASTAEAPKGDQNNGEESGGTETGGTEGGGKECRVNSTAPEITNNISKLPPNPHGWKLTNQTNYNACSDLSYALITQARQGNAQFATQLMLFHKGKYIGIASDTVQQTEILKTTPSSVTVRMRDWEALHESGEANVAASKYFSDVTFRWDGGKVVPDGRIPNQNLPKKIGV